MSELRRTEQDLAAARLDTGLHLAALSSWLEYQLRHWDNWATQRDSAWLALPTGNPVFPSLGHFMRHAFSPLHRYADQVDGREPLDDSDVAPDQWESLSSHAWRCLQRHRAVCAGLAEQDWGRDIEFRTRSAGILVVSCAGALTHAATHCAWHLSGVAHLLRSQGTEPPQRSDLIFALAG